MPRIILVCPICNKSYERLQSSIKQVLAKGQKTYCSKQCRDISLRQKSKYTCNQCGLPFERIKSQVRTSKVFCTKTCNTIYQNLNKTHGYGISKLEKYLQSKLTEIYPSMEFKFNDRTAIGSELDIYIPSLKLAFELNGLFHYEPIFGEDKLTKTQNNDNRKFQACLENRISLCVIDTSSQKYFKESTSQKYLDVICQVVNKGIEPLP